MNITSKQLHSFGFKYNWINVHFKHIKIGSISHSNLYNIQDVRNQARVLLLACLKAKDKRNRNSERLLTKLLKDLDEYQGNE